MVDRVSAYSASHLTQEQQVEIKRRLANPNPTHASARAYVSLYFVKPSGAPGYTGGGRRQRRGATVLFDRLKHVARASERGAAAIAIERINYANADSNS